MYYARIVAHLPHAIAGVTQRNRVSIKNLWFGNEGATQKPGFSPRPA